MEALQRDYGDRGVRFIYIYKSLAHPELNGYVQPETLAERLAHLTEAKERLNTRFEWLCDAMDNRMKRAFGDRPNAEFLIDPEGVVVRRRVWSDPEALRQDLETLIGPVSEPTRPEDVAAGFQPPRREIHSGVVERVAIPEGLRPITIERLNADGAGPAYVKPRVEVTASLLRGRQEGVMYLGFHLDPIYRAHWNNEVAPLRFDIESPNAVKITPATGEAGVPDAPADLDPREFILQLDGVVSGAELRLTYTYVACDDAETFCAPMKESYRIRFEIDRDAGSAIRRSNGSEAVGRRPPSTRRGPRRR